MVTEVERTVERTVPGGNLRPDGTQALDGKLRVLAKIEGRVKRDGAWLRYAEEGVWKMGEPK